VNLLELNVAKQVKTDCYFSMCFIFSCSISTWDVEPQLIYALDWSNTCPNMPELTTRQHQQLWRTRNIIVRMYKTTSKSQVKSLMFSSFTDSYYILFSHFLSLWFQPLFRIFKGRIPNDSGVAVSGNSLLSGNSLSPEHTPKARAGDAWGSGWRPWVIKCPHWTSPNHYVYGL
jgi:hypothetical protein